MTARPLFSMRPLVQALDRIRRHRIDEYLSQWDLAAIVAALPAPDTAVIEKIVNTALPTCPALHRDRAKLARQDLADEIDEFGLVTIRQLVRLTLTVPFSGDHDIFQLIPSNRSPNPPEAEIIRGEIHLFREIDSHDFRPDEIKVYFDGQLDEIDRNLAAIRQDLEIYRPVVYSDVLFAFDRHLLRALEERDYQAQLGFRISQRSDDIHSADRCTPRKISESQHPTEVADCSDDEAYETAVAALCNMRNTVERLTTRRHLGEEQIRDVLLVGLNAQFKGTAAGEVFNGAGKTDILIRVDDRNVFIGECKICKGPKSVTDALDQLLGNLVWRDTKAALLLFIRHKDVTAMIKKAVAAIETHPNVKGRGNHNSDGTIDFVVHANGDSNRKIRLAVIPFALGPRTR